MSQSPIQYSLTTLFAWVTFAAVMCWLASLSVFTCILAVIIAKHVFVAWLCMLYMAPRRRGGGGRQRPERAYHTTLCSKASER